MEDVSVSKAGSIPLHLPGFLLALDDLSITYEPQHHQNSLLSTEPGTAPDLSQPPNMAKPKCGSLECLRRGPCEKVSQTGDFEEDTDKGKCWGLFLRHTGASWVQPRLSARLLLSGSSPWGPQMLLPHPPLTRVQPCMKALGRQGQKLEREPGQLEH